MQISSVLEQAIRSEKLKLDKLLLDWPFRDSRLREIEKQLGSLSLASHSLSSPPLLGTASMNVFKHYLPLVQLGFRVWIEKRASLCDPSQVNLQWMKLTCDKVNDYGTMLLFTFLDWMWPNTEMAVETVENANFWHYERLLQLIHELLTWPSSNYILQWCKAIQRSEDGLHERMSTIFDFLLLLASNHPQSLFSQSTQSLVHAYSAITRPTYLEEVATLETLFPSLSHASFYKPQLSRPTSDLSTIERDISFSENGLEAPQATTLDRLPFPATLAKFRNTPQESSLAWITLCSSLKPSSSLSSIQFIIQDLLFGDMLLHTSLSVAIQLLSNLRSTFNESLASFIANIIRSFLIIERQQVKASTKWFRSRCGSCWVMPKILQTLLKFRETSQDLAPAPPPSFFASSEHIMQSVLVKLGTESEDLLVREEIAVGEMGMNVVTQVSVLPDLISILAGHQLVSHYGLQLVMQLIPREEIRVLLEDAEASNWKFALPPSNAPLSSLLPTLQATSAYTVDFLANCNTIPQFKDAMDLVTQSLLFPSPHIDQSVIIIYSFITSNNIDSELIPSEDAGSPQSVTTKSAILFECLASENIIEVLTMIIPLEQWVFALLSILNRNAEEAPEKSTKLCEISQFNFSAAFLFLLQLLSITRSLVNLQTKQHLLEQLRRFAHPYSTQNVGTGELDAMQMDWQDFDHDSPREAPNAPMLAFLYRLFNNQAIGIRNLGLLERMMASMLNFVDGAELLAVSPWMWVNSCTYIVDTCNKYPSIKGGHNERYELVLPVLEAFHVWTTKMPALRPLILKHMLHEHLFGVSDSQNLVHGTWMVTMIEELLVRWIVVPSNPNDMALLENATHGNLAPYSRIVCLSFCKMELVRLLKKEMAFRTSEWGQSLSKMLHDTSLSHFSGSSSSFVAKEVELKADPDTSPPARSVVTTGLKIRFAQRPSPSSNTSTTNKPSSAATSPESRSKLPPTSQASSAALTDIQQLQSIWEHILQQKVGDRMSSEVGMTNFTFWLSSLQQRLVSAHPHDIMMSAVHWILQRSKLVDVERVLEVGGPIKVRNLSSPSHGSLPLANGTMDVDHDTQSSSMGYSSVCEEEGMTAFAILKKQVELVAYALANIVPQQYANAKSVQRPTDAKGAGDERTNLEPNVPIFNQLLSRHDLIIFFFDQVLPTLLQRDADQLGEEGLQWMAYFSFLLINFSCPIISEQLLLNTDSYSFEEYPSHRNASSSLGDEDIVGQLRLSHADFPLLRSAKKVFEMVLVIVSSTSEQRGELNRHLSRVLGESWFGTEQSTFRHQLQNKSPKDRLLTSVQSRIPSKVFSNGEERVSEKAWRGGIGFALLFLRLVASSSSPPNNIMFLIFQQDVYPGILKAFIDQGMMQCAIQSSLPTIWNMAENHHQMELCAHLWKMIVTKSSLQEQEEEEEAQVEQWENSTAAHAFHPPDSSKKAQHNDATTQVIEVIRF